MIVFACLPPPDTVYSMKAEFSGFGQQEVHQTAEQTHQQTSSYCHLVEVFVHFVYKYILHGDTE